MARFLIPNDIAGGAPVATFDPQAGPDSVDFDIMAEGISGNGVLSGCVVTAQGTPDATVAVSAGVLSYAGQRVTVNAVSSAAMAADSSNPRFYLVCATTGGAVTVTAGLPSANPVFPVTPANSVVLAAVYIGATSGAVQVQSTMIISKAVLTMAAALFNTVAIGRTTLAGVVLGLTAALSETGGVGRSTVDFDGSATYATTSASTQTHRAMRLQQTITANIALGTAVGIESATTLGGASSITTAKGVSAIVTHQQASPAAMTLSVAVEGDVVLNGGTETITRAVALKGTITGTGATVTDAVGLDLLTLTPATGTVWGMQVGNYQSYHVGPMAYGKSSAPTPNSIVEVAKTKTIAAVTSRGIYIDNVISSSNVSSVHHGMHVNDTVNPSALAPLVTGVNVDTSIITGTGGVSEFDGLRSSPTVSAGTTSVLVGLHTTPQIATTGSATLAVGVLVDMATAGSGSIAVGVGLAINTVVGTSRYGLQVGNFKSYHHGALSVGHNGDPQVSTSLDMSAAPGAFTPPQMTTAVRNALTAVNGMVIFNTTTGTLQARVSGAWVDMAPSTVTTELAAAAGSSTTANASVRPNVAFSGQGVWVSDDSTNNKTDVVISTPAPIVARTGLANMYVRAPDGTNVSGTITSAPQTVSAQDLFLTPMFIPNNNGSVATFTSISILVAAAITSGAVQFVGYASDSAGWPAAKVFDSAGVDVTLSTAQLYPQNFTAMSLGANWAPNPGKYWVGFWVHTAVTYGGSGAFLVATGNAVGAPHIGIPAPVSTNTNSNGIKYSSQATIPTTLLNVAASSLVGNMPVIWMKAL